MKSFSQFIAEKKEEEFFINSKGERVPLSKATRQDVGMAPKDPINVTPESEAKSGAKSKGKTPVKTKVKASDYGQFKSLADQQAEIRKAEALMKREHPQFQVKYKDGSPTVVKPSKAAYAGKAFKGQDRVTASIPSLSKKLSITTDSGRPSRSITKLGRVATGAEKTAEFIKTGKNINRVEPTVNLTNPKKFKSFLDRTMQATGVKRPIKKTLVKTDKVTGLSAKDLKNLKGKVRAGGILKGAGRFAGGVFAVKDGYDKARIEKAKGRSKTSQVAAGIARGAGGYIGGAIGATLGTVAGGGFGSAVLGTGGAIAGYNVGTKVGDYLYKKGRQFATGEKKIKFKNFMKNIRK